MNRAWQLTGYATAYVSAIAIGLGSAVAIINVTSPPGLPVNPAVTQVTLGRTVCTAGWTDGVRDKAQGAVDRYKRDDLDALPAGVSHDPGDYQEDHIISLVLGGAPDARRNLRLEPNDEARHWDKLETALGRALCEGVVTLKDARAFEWKEKRASG